MPDQRQSLQNTYFYNWYAGTAGSGKASSGGWTSASDSICPRGWQLPEAQPSDSKSYGYLGSQYGSTLSEQGIALRKYPVSIPLLGYYTGTVENNNISTVLMTDYVYPGDGMNYNIVATIHKDGNLSPYTTFSQRYFTSILCVKK